MATSQSFSINHSIAEINLYTKIGYQDYLDDSGYPRLRVENHNVYAKSIKDKKSKHLKEIHNIDYSYYVLTDPNKNLYNPMDLLTIEPKIKKSFLNKVCKSELVFTQVPQTIFEKYLNFLKTENIKWLKEAQRELL